MAPTTMYSRPGTTDGPWTVRDTAPHIATWMICDSEGMMVCEVTNRTVAEKIAADHNAAPHLLAALKSIRDRAPPTSFSYLRWRHGGWSVSNVRYPNGASGCVSNNYHDRKWRIACDPRPFERQPTFRNRDEAALAEWHLIQREMAADAVAKAEAEASA